MIYTSYFAELGVLPKDIVPVSIALYKPKWYRGLEYPDLAPTNQILNHWKQFHDKEAYQNAYTKIVLNTLYPNQVVDDLYRMADNKTVCLLCYEKPSDFCHRKLVAQWIREHTLESCQEWIG